MAGGKYELMLLYCLGESIRWKMDDTFAMQEACSMR